MFYTSTPCINKRIARATVRNYICQLTYQLILVQDIDECRQDTCWGAPSTPVKALSTFSRQLLDSYLENEYSSKLLVDAKS